MRKLPKTMTLALSADEIDGFSEWLGEIQAREKIERKDRVRVSLLAEDILLRMRDHFGEKTEVTVALEKHIARSRIRIETRGESFNPLRSDYLGLGSWESSLSTSVGLAPQYVYENGLNVLSITLPRVGLNPALQILRAIVISVALGVLGKFLLPLFVRDGIASLLLAPAYDVWNRMLNAISGPIIFLTVITTMLNTRHIKESGGSSLHVIGSYFGLSIAMVWVALLCTSPVFVLDNTMIEFNVELFQGLLNNLFSAIPSNLVDPFLESNTSQLLFLAFALGYLLIRLGGRVDELTKIVRQANVVGLQMAGVVSWLVPIFTGIFLCLEVWGEKAVVLYGMWKPLVLALAISMAMLLAVVLFMADSMRVKWLLLLKKLWPSFWIALRTGSLDASFDEAEWSCANQMGIDAKFVRTSFPQGLVLYMPISAVGTIVFTLFAAREVGVQVNSVWYASAIVMAVVVFVATPPVPGANLLAYVVLFSTLGIPSEILIDAMIYDIVFGIFAGAANQAMLQLQLIEMSERLGLIDRDVLGTPVQDKKAVDKRIVGG